MWKSSDLNVIQIDNNGQFSIVGEVDDTAIVSVWVDGNESAKVAIPVKVVDTTDDKLDIHLTPVIEKIRQHETMGFEVQVSKHGESYSDFASTVSLNSTQTVLDNKFLSIVNKGSNIYDLSCVAFDSTLKTLYVTVTDNDNSNTFKESFELRTVNMFG